MKVTKGSLDELLSKTVEHIKEIVLENRKSNKRTSIVLSGGISPIPLYCNLALGIHDWSDIDIFLGDERCYGEFHERSNRKMIIDTLISRVDISPDNVYFPITLESYDDMCDDYEKRISNYLENRNFDIMLLGVGDDGNILSCSSTEELEQSGPNYFNKKKIKGEERLSATVSVLNKVDNVIVFVPGEHKKRIMRKVLVRFENETYAALALKKLNCNLTWYIS